MPDITMCDNILCPKRPGCYRAMATPSEPQSYAHFEPTESPVNGFIDCEAFWPLDPSTGARFVEIERSTKPKAMAAAA